MGITCAILFLLFVFQRTGTSKVGFTFAPIVIIWFAANVMINLYNIAIYYPGEALCIQGSGVVNCKAKM